jgi:genome maintenance exonuclease 1
MLDKWRKRIGIEQAERISTQAARRGTEIHSLMENYIIEGQVPTDLMPTKKHIFNGLRNAVDKNLQTIRSIEASLYSHRLKLAGRCDMIGEWAGINSVIDYKTSAKMKREDWIKDYFMQCTAYSIMFEELTGIEVPNVVLLIGVDEEAEPQVFVRPRNNYVTDLFKVLNEYYERVA